ncbi:MAG: GAF domain-containing protein [Anaerolineaceae bacterium]|nr:GAF domain-containing protein [Anaerolineaceae bacterium]
MMYILMLQPSQRSNQLFAVYMLTLVVSSYNILVVSTTSDVFSVYSASRMHALATLLAGPLLWLLLWNTFVPKHQFTRWLSVLLQTLTAVVLVVGVIDWLTAAGWLFHFDAALYGGGYVPVNQVLNGRFSSIFYAVFIPLLNTLLIVPISWFAFTPLLPERLRRAARVLLLFSFSVLLLYLPWFDLPPALRSMLTPVFAAVGAGWVVSTYRFFSPMQLAMKQVVDTVMIGLLVFDEQLVLVDANAFSVQHLPIQLAKDRGTLSFAALVKRLLPDVENEAELRQLETAVRQNPEQSYQQEIVLRDGRSSAAAAKSSANTWILLAIRPVYNNNQIFLGLSCSLEDLTVERRTQAYITETHKTIEQSAYNQALLNDITQAAISAQDFETTLSVLASRLVGLFAADHCYISLWDEVEQRSRPVIAYGEGTEPYLTVRRERDEMSISTAVQRSRRVLAIEDIGESPFAAGKGRLLPSRSLLALPMIADEQFVGTLIVGFNQARTFIQEEITLGVQIARQLTLAIFKNYLLATEKEQRVLLEALQAASQALTSTLDFEQVLDRILEEMGRVIPYDAAHFALIDNDEAVIVRRRHFDPDQSRAEIARQLEQFSRFQIKEMTSLRRMYETKRPLLISNTAKYPGWMKLVGQVKSWLGVPLVVGNIPIAFLMVDKFEADFYQRRHEEWLTAFASQATLALQHAQFFTEIQRRVTELEALSTVSAALRSSETVPVILQAVLQAMVEILSARVGVAFVVNEAGTAVVSQASYPIDFYPKDIVYPLGEGITGFVAQTGQVYITRDIHTDPRMISMPGEPESIAQLHSTIALPLISEEGILGVIHLGLDKVYEFADDEIHTLRAMSDIVANGLQRLHLMQTLEARVASRTYDLETANERLQELDKLKTKFIADVSHELRTPVANLSIYIDLLQHGYPEKQAHYITVLQQQAARLTDLVEATLGLSRLEMGAQDLALGPVALNPVVADILLGHQARAEGFGLQIAGQFEPQLPPVRGNQTQLSQLVTNLVANAINYSRQGGWIRVETFSHNDDMVCLRVSDDGIGISEEEMPHLFDRFYRGQRTGQSNIPGTGLGLAIVKEIVDLHQGQIEVSSQLNEGTQFSVYLPLDRSQERPQPQTPVLAPEEPHSFVE